MTEKMYFHILILCGIFCEGIIATLSDQGARESSDFLVRKRRVINHLPGGSAPMRIEEANYMANIQKNNGAHCAGAILSHYTVITAALCVNAHVSYYRVLSGAKYESNNAISHNITSKDLYYGNPPHDQYEGIALITVDPPFVYTNKIGYINLHVGPLATGTLVTVRGWGCSYPPQPGPVGRRALRSITLPIMNHEECRNVYRNRFSVNEKHICTYDDQQYCARTDIGAPLVFNGRLVGIHVWKGERRDLRNPDVFIDLQRHEYSAWIAENALLM